MKTEVVDPTVSRDWAEVVTEHDSDLFHSPQWIRVLATTYGFEPRAIVVKRDEGRVAGGIPFFAIDDIRGRRTVSLPFSDFCDPLLDRPDEWHAGVGELMRLGSPIIIRPLRNELPTTDTRFVEFNHAHWHAVSLQAEAADLWEALPSACRRSINKAERTGVKVRPATEKSDLRSFFALHLGVRKHKYRLLAQPYRFFEQIWDEFIVNDLGALLVADLEGQIIAASMFLDWRDRTYYKFSASDPRYVTARGSDALMWAGIKRGYETGRQLLDLGLSDWDQTGLVRFKEKFASMQSKITFLRWDPQPVADPHPDDRGLWETLSGLLTDSRVPDEITERGGDDLYRFFA